MPDVCLKYAFKQPKWCGGSPARFQFQRGILYIQNQQLGAWGVCLGTKYEARLLFKGGQGGNLETTLTEL